MKELITKLKEIETIVELNVGKELTEETATDIYELTNELMGKVKKLPIHNVMQHTLEMKLKAYESVCAWFENEYDSSSGDDTIRGWEDKGKELNAQINLLRHLIMETKHYVA